MWRVLLAALLLMAAGAFVPTRAAAAQPTTCSLMLMEGSESAQGQLIDGEFRFMTMWIATADCSDPTHPLHGEVAEIQQAARVRRLGDGMVGGPTRIQMEFTDLGVMGELSGEARGSGSPVSTESIELELEFRASGNGARLRGSETLTFKLPTGEVLEFKPPKDMDGDVRDLQGW